MFDIFKLFYTILEMGIRLTLSSGAVFQPAFQERTDAVYDFVKQESDKYEPNYEYSSTEWTPTFKLKENNHGKNIR